MDLVRLTDCIEGQHWLIDLANRSLYIDGISQWLGMRRYTVLKQEGKTNILVEAKTRRSCLIKTFLKIILVATLLFPLAMLFLKWQNLRSHQFVVQKQVEKPVNLPAVPNPPQVPLKEPEPFVIPIELPEWPVAQPLSPIIEKTMIHLTNTETAKVEMTKIEKIKPPHTSVLLLKDQNGNVKKVDRELACKASPVLKAALESSMLESENFTFTSPLFNEKVIKGLAAFIHDKSLPSLNLDDLMALYKASHYLQMGSLAHCREKIIQRLTYLKKIEDAQMLQLFELAETFEDSGIHLLILESLYKFRSKRPLVQAEGIMSHFKELKKQGMTLVWDGKGFLKLLLPTLTAELLPHLQALKVEHLEVQSAITTEIAEKLTSLKRLAIVDTTYGELEDDLPPALLKSTLQSLQLSYCNLSAKGAFAFAKAIETNEQLLSLSMIAVGIPEGGLREMMAALKKNQTLTFLQMSHETLPEKLVPHLATALLENGSIKQLQLKENRLSFESRSQLLEAVKNGSELVF